MIHGYGEVDMGNEHEVLANGGGRLLKQENAPKPYLLLDIRLEDEFKLGRIMTGKVCA